MTPAPAKLVFTFGIFSCTLFWRIEDIRKYILEDTSRKENLIERQFYVVVFFLTMVSKLLK
jgi:hypothetical protein